MKQILCPFHDERTASFTLYPDGAYCFGCHKLYKYKPGEEPEEREKYVEPIEDRIQYITSLPKKEIRGLNLHCDDRYVYIVWPGALYYTSRALDNAVKPKYKRPSGHAPLPLVAQSSGGRRRLILVEGEFNALSLATTGLDATIISPGGSGEFISENGRKMLSQYAQYDSIIVAVDEDKAGIDAMLRFNSAMTGLGKQILPILLKSDFNEILQERGPEGLKTYFQENLELSQRLFGNQESVQASGSPVKAGTHTGTSEVQGE